MTTTKVNNPLFAHLRRVVSGALELEYAVRASELWSPDGMAYLRSVNDQMKNLCQDLSQDQIRGSQVMDHAWDHLQFGYRLVRAHGKFFRVEHGPLLFRKVPQICSAIELDSEFRMRVPATRFYRICDLLNGNDVKSLFSKVGTQLEASEKEHGGSFLHPSEYLMARVPVPLHPDVMFVHDRKLLRQDNFALILDMNAEISAEELMCQLREFLYAYALQTQGGWSEKMESLIGDIFDERIDKNLVGSQVEFPALRYDGFAPPLSGLVCWDYVKRERLTIPNAIKKTLQIYPPFFGKVENNTIEKNYKNAQGKIRELKNKFDQYVRP